MLLEAITSTRFTGHLGLERRLTSIPNTLAYSPEFEFYSITPSLGHVSACHVANDLWTELVMGRPGLASFSSLHVFPASKRGWPLFRGGLHSRKYDTLLAELAVPCLQWFVVHACVCVHMQLCMLSLSDTHCRNCAPLPSSPMMFA